MNYVHFSSLRSDWQTPESVYEKLDSEFEFNYDPCPAERGFPSEDGLLVHWGDRTYCNPPYGREIIKWIGKAWEESQQGKTIVMLLPSRTDARWWHKYAMQADEIRFIEGRLKFKGAKHNAPFPSCVVIFRGKQP